MVSTDHLIDIAQNLKFLIIGISVAVPLVVVLLGFIGKFLWKKLEKLDAIEDRMRGIFSFANGIEKLAEGLDLFKKEINDIKARVTVIEKMCDRRHLNKPVAVERRKRK